MSHLPVRDRKEQLAFFFPSYVHTQHDLTMASELELSSSFIPALYKPAALLPIARHKQSLQYLVETYPVTIVVGQTGSGKTTQLPQYLDQAGWCQDGKAIAVTQVSGIYGDEMHRANTIKLSLAGQLPRLSQSEWQRRCAARLVKKLGTPSALKT